MLLSTLAYSTNGTWCCSFEGVSSAGLKAAAYFGSLDETCLEIDCLDSLV